MPDTDDTELQMIRIFSFDADGCCVGTVYKPEALSEEDYETTLRFNALNIMSLYKYQEGTMSYLRNFSGALHEQLLNASQQGPTVVMSGSARQSPLVDLTNMEKRLINSRTGQEGDVVAVSSSIGFELQNSTNRLRGSNPQAAGGLSYDPASLSDLLHDDDQAIIAHRQLCQKYGQAIHLELKAAAVAAVHTFNINHPENATFKNTTLPKQNTTQQITELTMEEQEELSNLFFKNYKGDAIKEAKKVHSQDYLTPKKDKLDIIYFQIQKMAEKYPDANIEFNFMDDRPDILQKLAVFYSSHRDLIPKNVTLHLYEYSDTKHLPPTLYKIPPLRQYRSQAAAAPENPIRGTGEYNPSYKAVLKEIFKQDLNQEYGAFFMQAVNDGSLTRPRPAPTTSNQQEDTGVSASTAPLPRVGANNASTFFKPTPAAGDAPAPDNTPPKPQP